LIILQPTPSIVSAHRLKGIREGFASPLRIAFEEQDYSQSNHILHFVNGRNICPTIEQLLADRLPRFDSAFDWDGEPNLGLPEQLGDLSL
jgi:hypothetical protein